MEETKMKKLLFLISVMSLCLILVTSSPLYAIPYLQVYIPGSTAGTVGPDQDTWFSTGLPGTINLDIVVNGKTGANHATTVDYVTLLMTVPASQTGTVTGLLPITLEAPPLGSGNFPNVDKLTNVSGNDGYNSVAFLPLIDNHYPLNKPGFDYIIFNLGPFSLATLNTLPDYNASTGTIPPLTGPGWGEVQSFSIAITGFDWVHFDVYALFDGTNFTATWIDNPGSHDSTATAVPEPGILILLGIAMGAIGVASWKIPKL
jgi:hypothetical protein